MSLYFFRYSPLLLSSYARLPSNFSWPISCQFRARTLGYTAIGFGSFSVLFTLFYPLALSAFKKHTKSYLVCSFMIQHNMAASTTMFRCNFLKHWIIFFISMLNKYFFKSIHVWCICPILFRTCI